MLAGFSQEASRFRDLDDAALARAKRIDWLRDHLPVNCPDNHLDTFCAEVIRQLKELEGA